MWLIDTRSASLAELLPLSCDLISVLWELQWTLGPLLYSRSHGEAEMTEGGTWVRGTCGETGGRGGTIKQLTKCNWTPHPWGHRDCRGEFGSMLNQASLWAGREAEFQVGGWLVGLLQNSGNTELSAHVCRCIKALHCTRSFSHSLFTPSCRTPNSFRGSSSSSGTMYPVCRYTA